MFIVLGATGHVGSAVANALVDLKQPVLAIAHDPEKATDLRSRGAEIAVADVRDPNALREIFKRGRRLFLLNPPADPKTDTELEERKTSRAIVQALDGSGLEKVVALSTYGAGPRGSSGDLAILYELEQALAAQTIPTTILRAAYFMSNWDAQANAMKNEGKLHAFFPEFFKLPMVAPKDLGHAAARLLLEATEVTGTHHMEGPERYAPAEVAVAFGTAFDRGVKAIETPRADWEKTLAEMGFSDAAANAFCAMTEAVTSMELPDLDRVTRGPTSIESYAKSLAASIK
jgi:uncharacterized protein YbjT (DUF2867 family)